MRRRLALVASGGSRCGWKWKLAAAQELRQHWSADTAARAAMLMPLQCSLDGMHSYYG
jgi:hypothetical protein